MRKLTIFLFLIWVSNTAKAQSLEIVLRSDIKLSPYPKEKPSVFIHPQTDTGMLQFVATYKATAADKVTIAGDLFLFIKGHARKDGANCFKLNSLVYDSMNRPTLYIDAYYGSDATVTANASHYETNSIYVFSSGQSNRDSFSLKVNNQVTTFNNAAYLKFTLTDGEELKLSKGGFTGAKSRLKYEQGKRPLYFMVFGGTGSGGAPFQPPGTVGVTFTTGEIKEMTDDYGQFLALVLKQAN